MARTIYVGADMSAVKKALGEIEKQAKASQSEMRMLERALKLDPENVELLVEKQKTLSNSIKNSTEKLKLLNKASEKVKAEYEKGEIDRGKYLEFKTSVSKTESQLKAFRQEADKTEQALKDIAASAAKGADETNDFKSSANKAEQALKDVADSVDKSVIKTNSLKTSASKASAQIDKSAISANKAATKYDIMSGSAKVASATLNGLVTVAKIAAGVLTVVTGAGVAAVGASVNVGKNFKVGMSEVAAISGSIGDELENLENKAKEMGASTKFSATEAAEGMKYMAMAGWNAEQMIGGIDGILNLAAASGEELGTTSDIVTDALTAFKMEASDSSHFADVLAKTSAKANTNVSLLGESFKYVAPLAGTLGYTAEDVAVALGVMANSGIKGSKAGTSLNASLTNLAKPTKKMKTIMDEYDIALTDTNGDMLSLRELLGNLREKFGGLSEAQQASAAGTLFGKEAMSGMLAIINASDDDFNTLIENIDNSDGAAEEMAKTMNNNLSGSITIFKSAAEGFGITVSEKLETPLREFVDFGTEKINELKDVFEQDGFNGLAKKGGEIFAEISKMAAENAPQMVDAGITFIRSFVAGINDNSDELKTAALKIASTLGDGLISFLPKKIQRPVKNAISDIKKSVTLGGLKKAGETISNIVENVGKGIEKLTKTILPPLTKTIDWTAENLDKLIPLITGVATAYAGWKIINSLPSAIGLATTAQWLWNAAMEANPAGLLIGAVSGLIGVVTALAFTLDHDTTADKAEEIGERMSDAYNNAFNAVSEFKRGVEESEGVLEGFNDNLIISDGDKQKLEDSWNDVQEQIGLIIQSASEERRGFTQLEIDKLQELFDKEKELSEQRLGTQTAYQSVTYDLAKEFVNTDSSDMSAEEYANNAQDYIKSAQDVRDEVLELSKNQYVSQLSEKKAMMEADSSLTQSWYDEQKAQLKQEYDTAVNNANQTYTDTINVIQQGYENKATALTDYRNTVRNLYYQSEDEERIHNQTMYNLDEKYRDDLQKAQENSLGDYIIWCQLETEATSKYQQEKSKEIERHNKKINEINDDFTEAFDEDAQEQYSVWLSMITDTQANGGKISKVNEDFVKHTTQILDRLPIESKQAMKDTVQGMIKGLEDDEPELYKKVSVMSNTFISKLKEVFGIHSPSRVMRKLFGYVGDGAVLGIEDSTHSLTKSAKNMASDFVNSAKNGINKIKINIIPELSLCDKNINNTIKQFDLQSIANLRMPSLKSTTLDTTQEVRQEKQTINNDNGITLVIHNFVNNADKDIDELVDTIDRKLAERANRRKAVYGY